MRPLLKIVLLLFSTALFCSCASTSLVDTWRNPSLRPERLQRVLVVSITKKDSNRRVYEETLSSELARRGVQAVAGYTRFPTGERIDWDKLDNAIKNVAAQAVLTVQTIKVEQQTTVQPGYVGSYPGYWYPNAFPAWNLHGYYGSMAHYGPSYISTYDIATMQVNLFDALSGKLLWAATFTSSEPEKVISVGKDLARIVVESLVKEGFI